MAMLNNQRVTMVTMATMVWLVAGTILVHADDDLPKSHG